MIQSKAQAREFAAALNKDLAVGETMYVGVDIIKDKDGLGVVGSRDRFAPDDFARQVLWPNRFYVNDWLRKQRFKTLSTWPNV